MMPLKADESRRLGGLPHAADAGEMRIMNYLCSNLPPASCRLLVAALHP